MRIVDSARGRTATFSADPINYKDAAGSWQPIDNGLTVDQADVAHNGANRYSADLPSDASGTFGFQTSTGSGLSWTITGVSGPRTIAGSTASYVLSGHTTLRMVATGDGLRETLLLADAAGDANQTELLSVSSEMTPTLEPDNSVGFNDPANPNLGIAPPMVRDARGARPPAAAVTVTLSASGSGRYAYTVAVDPVWITDPHRVFPITVDPTTTFATTSVYSCELDNTGGPPWPTQCSTNPYNVAVGPNTGGDAYDISRLALQFSGLTSLIPPTATISAASLTASVASSFCQNFNGAYDLLPLTRAWGAGATWLSSGTSGTWTNPGGDVGAVASTGSYPGPCGTGHTVTFSSLAGTVTGWVTNPPTGDGVLIKVHDESIDGLTYFSNVALQVTWSTPPTAPLTAAAIINSSTSLHVHWQPPASSGSAPISCYTLQAYDTQTNPPNQRDGPPSSCQSSTTFDLNNLTASHWHFVGIWATNQDGATGSVGLTGFTYTAYPATPPTPATNPLAVVAAPTQMTVSWGPPGYGSTINPSDPNGMYGYAVATFDQSAGGVAGPNTGTGFLAPTTRSITLAGFTTGHTYQVGIYAFGLPYSPDGFWAQTGYYSLTGPPSWMLVGVPSAPTAVSAVALQTGAAVYWSPPASGTPTSYTVRSSTGGTTAVAGTANTAIVGGLSPMIAYTFTVTATNGYGTGNPSGPSNGVTPLGVAAATNTQAFDYESQADYVTIFNSVDGVYEELVIPANMDVPVDSHGQVIHTVYPGNGAPIGLNARPMQIAANFPATAASNNDFFGVGVIAGCVDGPRTGLYCTGIAPDGGVYKMLYWDGCAVSVGSCAPGTLDGYSAAMQLQAVSAGETHTLQVQRRNLGQGYTFYLYIDNQNVPIDLNQYTMWYGFATQALESSTFGPQQIYPHQNLNETEPAFGNPHFHLYGQPSVPAPSLTNMQPSIAWAQGSFPAGCTLAQDPNPPHALHGTGSC